MAAPHGCTMGPPERLRKSFGQSSNKANPQAWAAALRLGSGVRAARHLQLEPRQIRRRWSRMPSTVIQSFEYDAGKLELRVLFRSGRRYVYLDVPETVHAAMRRSFSKGEYFNRFIRDRYAFRHEDATAV